MRVEGDAEVMVDPSNRTDSDRLIDLLRRSPILEALDDEPLDRRELQNRVDISRATVHRHTRLLADLGVIERAGDEFRLTKSGELVTDAVLRFKREVPSALSIAPVLQAIEDAPIEVGIEAFTDATVTNAARGDPYSPVARFLSLVEGTETLYGFDIDGIAPLYLEEIQRQIIDGMETDDLVLPEAVHDSLDTYPERCMEACASGNLSIQLHDNLPFSLAVFDDRVGVGVCAEEGRQLRVFVDTTRPEVREWAEAVYEAYEAEAIPMREYTPECFRKAMERGGLELTS